MNPFLVAILFFVALGAVPVWLISRRQRRARGTHDSHRPGHRERPPSDMQHLDSVPPAEMGKVDPMF